MERNECEKLFDISQGSYEADNGVYSAKAIAPTLLTTLNLTKGFWILENDMNNKLMKFLSENKIKETCSIDVYNQTKHSDCVQTILAGVNSRNNDYIREIEMEDKKITSCAERGREDGNQHLEVSDREEANAITTVQKDSMVAESDKPSVIGGFGNRCNKGTQWHEQNCVYDSTKVATAIPAEKSFHPYYGGSLKIRKLTPCECLRLMAFTKDDYLNLVNEGGLSSSAIYHCAGDSIVVNCLIGLFCGLIGTEAEPIQKRWAERVSHGLNGSENENQEGNADE